ncbi:response regulator receiver domain-containing protein [Arcticibacter tournemirensis]|uniref:Response regulator n=1 Tax=Arcticibacter tournemirensis TaxID=699437 RepID=A0A4V1KIX4_9SPHI|nr:response regulator [Arcticibacter tournemirensis]KAA8482772.1 response regulator [Arcticibacter tournemirensis]RXF72202.1 response regulator [Arcticibacter tournemirensis]TQM51073.1 response regulator receiver domain-containing protein [Arcticibacter tournemirensis]
MRLPLISAAIIDDDEIYRFIIARMLKNSGIALVFQAENGKKGIQQIETSLILPEVLIVDIEMPVMNGFETAQYIKMNWPQIGIIAHSSLIDDKTKALMIKSGADLFLPKPCSASELIGSICQLAVLK